MLRHALVPAVKGDLSSCDSRRRHFISVLDRYIHIFIVYNVPFFKLIIHRYIYSDIMRYCQFVKFLTRIFLRTRLITEVISDRARCFDARYTSRLLIRSFSSFLALSSSDSSSCRGLLKKTLKNERDDDCDYERTRTTARRNRQTDRRTDGRRRRRRRRMMMMSKSRRLA